MAIDRSFSLEFDAISVAMKQWTVERRIFAYVFRLGGRVISHLGDIPWPQNHLIRVLQIFSYGGTEIICKISETLHIG